MTAPTLLRYLWMSLRGYRRVLSAGRVQFTAPVWAKRINGKWRVVA